MSIARQKARSLVCGRRQWSMGKHVAPLLALVLLLGGASGAPVLAQQRAAKVAQAPVSIELTQFKVVEGPDGHERYLPADAVVPGDVIEYRVTYRNNGPKPVAGFAATLPIPEGTHYLSKSAAAPAGLVPEAATEDGAFAREPLMRKVKGPDGKWHDQPVPYAEYRTLRWPLGLLAGKHEVTVKARVQVDLYAPPEARAGQDSSPSQSQAAAANKAPTAASR